MRGAAALDTVRADKHLSCSARATGDDDDLEDFGALAKAAVADFVHDIGAKLTPLRGNKPLSFAPLSGMWCGYYFSTNCCGANHYILLNECYRAIENRLRSTSALARECLTLLETSSTSVSDCLRVPSGHLPYSVTGILSFIRVLGESIAKLKRQLLNYNDTDVPVVQDTHAY